MDIYIWLLLGYLILQPNAEISGTCGVCHTICPYSSIDEPKVSGNIATVDNSTGGTDDSH